MSKKGFILGNKDNVSNRDPHQFPLQHECVNVQHTIWILGTSFRGKEPSKEKAHTVLRYPESCVSISKTNYTIYGLDNLNEYQL